MLGSVQSRNRTESQPAETAQLFSSWALRAVVGPDVAKHAAQDEEVRQDVDDVGRHDPHAVSQHDYLSARRLAGRRFRDINMEPVLRSKW